MSDLKIRKIPGTENGGIRIRDGLARLLCDCFVVHGIHNTVYGEEMMLEGMLVLKLGMGSWVALYPLREKANGGYFEMLDGMHIDGDDRHRFNDLLFEKGIEEAQKKYPLKRYEPAPPSSRHCDDSCPGCGAPGGRQCQVVKTTCGY